MQLMNGRVVVADGNPINSELFCFLLEEAGFAVNAVEDGDGALRAIGEERADILVCDVQLAGMSGFALTERIRSERVHPALCIVMVTAYAMDSDRAAAYTSGCDGYISKPVDTRRFVEQIREFWTSKAREG
jgi:CheY-like chemotaxis protein